MAGEITFKLRREEYADVARVTLLRNLRTRRFAGKMAAFASLGALCGLWLGWDGSFSAQLAWIVCGALYPAILIVTIIGGTYLLLPRRSGRLYDQQRTLDDDLTFVWTTSSLAHRSIKGHADIAWRDFHDKAEGRGLFLFYLNDQLCQALPKRAMTDDQIADLRGSATSGMTIG